MSAISWMSNDSRSNKPDQQVGRYSGCYYLALEHAYRAQPWSVKTTDCRSVAMVNMALLGPVYVSTEASGSLRTDYGPKLITIP